MNFRMKYTYIQYNFIRKESSQNNNIPFKTYVCYYITKIYFQSNKNILYISNFFLRLKLNIVYIM